MKRLFRSKKEKPSPASVEKASEELNKRGDVVNEKVKKLDAELTMFKEQLKKTRPGPSHNALKARALRILKQKKMYEGQRDMLYNQAFSLDQVSFASEGIKDAQQTMVAMTVAKKELSGTFRTLKIDEIDKMQDEMLDLAGYRSEIQDSLGESYSVPDHLDEELMGELTALEDDMVSEIHNDQMPAYLQPEKAHELEAGFELPSAPFEHGPTKLQHTTQGVDEDDLPAAPKASSIKT
ncbi:hypothetical protein SUGI_1051910 [Cryptomeria japonica]|uniref:vacuolar protein sorting-associated protein 60.1 n=1 Tax=Cryptomeria japonica TaxID=3369 RepID=UPI002414BE06|nr:vacuolar protein sorting-associated protein 60.1 [Cryptomeria japonica]GLJ49589.1 hypothetical protein SUGI_1051910 [Cryptomeria japonica]